MDSGLDGSSIPVEWRTWASRADRIRLREADAVRLVQEIQNRSAMEFKLVLVDDPELSATYDVSNLVDAIIANDMKCFEVER